MVSLRQSYGSSWSKNYVMFYDILLCFIMLNYYIYNIYITFQNDFIKIRVVVLPGLATINALAVPICRDCQPPKLWVDWAMSNLNVNKTVKGAARSESLRRMESLRGLGAAGPLLQQASSTNKLQQS